MHSYIDVVYLCNNRTYPQDRPLTPSYMSRILGIYSLGDYDN